MALMRWPVPGWASARRIRRPLARGRQPRCGGSSTRRPSVVEGGETPDRACERGHVVVAVTVRDEATLELCRERADRQDRPELIRELERDAEVLAMERHLEPERIVVIDHPAAAVGQHPALRGPAA